MCLLKKKRIQLAKTRANTYADFYKDIFSTQEIARIKKACYLQELDKLERLSGEEIDKIYIKEISISE